MWRAIQQGGGDEMRVCHTPVESGELNDLLQLLNAVVEGMQHTVETNERGESRGFKH